ncbi:MAG: hypothetical protein ABSB32_13445 [Thermodesulfobacteriota bacterium]|jgi:hypothetical protein
MRHGKWLSIPIVFFLVFLTSNSKVYPGNPDDVASLRGLWVMSVLVESLPPDIEGKGLTKEQIQTDVELKLRLAGIKVFSDEEWVAIPRSPYLYVNAHVMVKRDIRLAVYNIDIELRQWVILERDPKIKIIATTWDIGYLGSIGSDQIGDIRNSIKALVDIFINGFLSVNPKGGK